MKRGFVTETHVLVYCDGCGEPYTESTPGGYADAEETCFDSIAQAVHYINARSTAVGWVYDGDRVLCHACRATDHTPEYIDL
ncbi:hypothetical protein ACL02S_16365 [Nocardia sp. 004]|uniref:hypothetical protein n=1 Tax=Nocardia sp. 004 TaxID=3385978 RepID=UPI00399F56E3